jgi:hypothetical protein
MGLTQGRARTLTLRSNSMFCDVCEFAKTAHGPGGECPDNDGRYRVGPLPPPLNGLNEERLDAAIREFATGATRNLDSEKYDYEAFLSPAVLERFARYMHAHRFQGAGKPLRAGDDWQKGIPREVYLKSLVRHTMDFWRKQRGSEVIDPDTKFYADPQDLACAIMFNIMGWLHEELKTTTQQKG